MNEDFVSYQMAMSFKEAGFNETSLGKYVDCPNDPTLFYGMLYEPWNLDKNEILAPSLWQAAKWLRDAQGIAINVIAHDASQYCCQFKCLPNCKLKQNPNIGYYSAPKATEMVESYEKALVAGLFMAINMAKDGIDTSSKELNEDEETLASYYDGCTNCHAYDMGGRLFGRIVIEFNYDGNSNDTRVIDADLKHIGYDPWDE